MQLGDIRTKVELARRTLLTLPMEDAGVDVISRVMQQRLQISLLVRNQQGQLRTSM